MILAARQRAFDFLAGPMLLAEILSNRSLSEQSAVVCLSKTIQLSVAPVFLLEMQLAIGQNPRRY